MTELRYYIGEGWKPIRKQHKKAVKKPKINHYSQKWSEYDKAKTNENIFFKKLLQELLFITIDEVQIPKRGRKPYSIIDKIFCMCIKIYHKSDLRKTTSILKELKQLHYLERAPSFKTLDNFFNEKDLNNILDELILISALPLANLEDTGAIDSTGFSTSRFDRWVNYKWGKHEGKERVWRKAHASVGCKTNVFFSVEVTEKNVGDAPLFEKVVGNKPLLFDLENFVADKAYSSRKILQFLHSMKIVPYIPFKKNTTIKSKGHHIWHKMFWHFKNHNDEFMEKYHKRSNIETSFHMLKSRFGDSVKTKSLVANSNEIKVKILCHNICVLIQEAFENNIFCDFEDCVKKAVSV